MNVSVLGAGAWGTAMAIRLAAASPVRLWTRAPAHAEAMRAERVNTRYLPGQALPAGR